MTSTATRENGKMTSFRRRPPSPALQPAISWQSLGLLLLIYATAAIWIMARENAPRLGLSEGERAPVTVVASVDFTCVDLARTQIEQARAEQQTPPVFIIHSAAQSLANRTLDKLFDRLIQARGDPTGREGDISEDFASTLDLLGIPLTASDVAAVIPGGFERETQDAIRAALRKAWLAGIVSEQDRQSRFGGLASEGIIVIKRADGTLDNPVPLDRLPTPDEALAAAAQDILSSAFATNMPATTLTALLRPWLAPNLLYDPHATAENRRRAREAVAPFMMSVKAGTTLAESGQRLTAQQAALLAAHESRQRTLETPLDRVWRTVGMAGILLALLITCVALARVLWPSRLRNDTFMVLWLLLTATALALAHGAVALAQLSPRFPASAIPLTAPVAWAPLVAAMLLGYRAALIIGLWTAGCLAVFFQTDFSLLLYGWLVAVVTAHSAVTVRKRSQMYRAGLLAGLTGVFYALALGTLQQQTLEITVIRAASGLSSGLACGFLASLLIYFFEHAFGLTTDLTLLELSDLGHPLLQRLAMEAPGTYHHSIVVAHLAEAAATSIGAHALLVRVSAYFHDIGKLAKPDFYIENTAGSQNPHDQLAPEMSTLLIRSHVQEGLTLARRHKLPACVQDAIVQHHGTSVIAYFYKQALQKAANGNKPNEADFRYGGPLPQSREMGILMLADTVEAAVRSIDKPDEERIAAAIRDKVEAKIKDGQLDECPLTLSEIRQIRESFAFTLASMLHVRIPYPDDENSPEKSAKDRPHAARAG